MAIISISSILFSSFFGDEWSTNAITYKVVVQLIFLCCKDSHFLSPSSDFSASEINDSYKEQFVDKLKNMLNFKDFEVQILYICIYILAASNAMSYKCSKTKSFTNCKCYIRGWIKFFVFISNSKIQQCKEVGKITCVHKKVHNKRCPSFRFSELKEL